MIVNKITIVGSGYVGMSMAVLFSQHNNVVVLDIDPLRVNKINNMQSTVADTEIENFLKTKNLTLRATLDKNLAYDDADFIVVATPTNYDSASNYFDTSSVDSVIYDAIKHNPNAFIVIKSTIPVGYTKSLQEKYKTKRIIFSPEFLREGKALKDNLNPSRIIIGSLLEEGKIFANLLVQAAQKKDVEKLFIPSNEAEAVKLFANSYLAMRVSFFNELDSYAMANGLDTQSIIKGLCLDDRIGKGYNNPSFGYGGYCLPKDTKQLLANYKNIPQTLISAIVSSNSTRKDFIVEEIIKLNPTTVGIYLLAMKYGSDNYRSSAIIEIMESIKIQGFNIIIYEPSFTGTEFNGSKIINSLDEFKNISDVVVANRYSNELNDISEKVFTRDVFGSD